MGDEVSYFIYFFSSLRLTQDSVYEKFPDSTFSSIKTLDFPNSGLKQVDLSPVKNFDNLLR